MIALGLSVLFGMGWAVGLLASSDLPDAVRYPAEWIFTLATAFLGVYLFLLYVIRSPEARRLWKRWLCCQYKKKQRVSFSSSHPQNKGRFRTISSTLASWRGTLRDKRDAASISEGRRSSNIRSGSIQLQPVNVKMVEKMKPEEWRYSDTFSPEPPIYLSEGGKEVSLEETVDRGSGQYATTDESVFSVAEETTEEKDPGDWCYSKVHSSYQLNAGNLLPVSDAPPSQSNPSLLSSAKGECYILKNKQAERKDIIPE